MLDSKDKHAVAVYKDAVIVGHVPYNISASLSAFLRRDLNKEFAEITGGKVNRGAGYGLEIPLCVSPLWTNSVYKQNERDGGLFKRFW